MVHVPGTVTDPSLCPPRCAQPGGPAVPDPARGVGLFQEKPHSLQNNIRASLEKKQRGSGVLWASRPEAPAQGQWGMRSAWGGGGILGSLSLWRAWMAGELRVNRPASCSS